MRKEIKQYRKIIKKLVKRFNSEEHRVQAVIEEIIAMAEQSPDNVIDLQDIVDAAESESSILHKIFDWNGTNEDRLNTIESIFKEVTFVLAGTNGDEIIEIEEYGL